MNISEINNISLREAALNRYKEHLRKWGNDKFLNTSFVDDANYDWFSKKTKAALDAVRKGKPLLIGLCGNMGVGKDSATEFCVDHDIRCRSVAFADPIREIGRIFGFTQKQMTDRVLKEQLDDFWKFSPRYFMQKVGTEMFREKLREDVWVELMRKRLIDLSLPFEAEVGFPNSTIDTYRVIFITDVRFPNEAQAIRDLGGSVFRIKRDGFSKKFSEDLHPSERYISQIPVDLEIENNSKDEQEWTWNFTKAMIVHFKHDAYYGN